MRGAPLLIPAVVGLLAGAAPGSSPGREETGAGLVERVHVGRVRLPVTFRARSAGACDDLAPGDILVREGGIPRRVTALERYRPPTLHAVLLDTSGSTDAWLGTSDRAIRSYLEGLPATDRLMQATFDEDLRLLRPPTPVPLVEDHDRTGTAAIEDARPRPTALWDAVDGMVRALATVPEERRVLLLLTDGCDSLSLPGNHAGAVRTRAAVVYGLTVFPVLLGDATRCSRGGSLAPRTPLEALARATGGWLIPSHSQGSLRVAYAVIREHLDSEGVVVYEVPAREPAGEGQARVVPAPRPEVKVGVRGGGGCRLRRAAAGSPVGPAAAAARPSSFWIEDGKLAGRVEDLERERGNLYLPGTTGPGGSFRLQGDLQARRVARTVRVGLRPLPDLLLHPGPAAAILWWLENGGSGRAADALQGQAFLEAAVEIGLGLQQAPGYREWAGEKILEARRLQVSTLLREAGVAEGSPTALALARDLLARPATPSEVTPRLASWLGDLRAVDLAAELDRLAAQEVLAAPAPGRTAGDEADSLPPLAARVAAVWPALRAAFPPPEARRVHVPLVPALDPRQEAIGFYRIRAPEPRPGRPPEDGIPLRPLGLELILWLRTAGWPQPGAAAPDLGGLSYRPLTGVEARDLREWLYRAGRAGWRSGRKGWLAMDVQMVGDWSQQALLTVLWAPQAGAFCAGLRGTPGASQGRLAATLQATLIKEGRLCLTTGK